MTNTGNTAIGYRTLVGSSGNSDGYSNTAMGYQSLRDITGGDNNTCYGYETGRDSTTSEGNTFIGYQCGLLNTTGGTNTVVGYYSGRHISTGAQNVLIGNNVGTYVTNLTTGSKNILIGPYARISSSSVDNEFVIAHNATGKGNRTFYVNSDLGVYHGGNTSTWATTSDIRIKKNVTNNDTGLDKIKQIQVRNFEYRTVDEITDFENPDAVVVDQEGSQLGVIAQEIQQVLPDTVTQLSTGALSVNADNVTWYLVNAVKELSAENTALKQRLDAAGL